MKIFLVCSGGMSTSLLVQAMKKEAQARQLQVDIEALPLSVLPQKIKEASCVLIAPQVRHRAKSIEELAQKEGKCVGIIDGQAYGKIDGKSVLEHALSLLNAP
jgi:PTS system cellobiose-specific IIB component